MRPEDRDRLFGFQHAFEHAVTLWVTIAVIGVLVLAVVAIFILGRIGRIDKVTHNELILRTRSWIVLAPMILVPILAGAAWTILGVTVLSLLCYREYARATGLFREKTISIVVVLGILLVGFAALDHWYRLFVALGALVNGSIAIAAIVRDEPRGYIQRVALGVLGFTLFGQCLGHLAYFANASDYRPILILILLCVEMNDVFAYLVGKTFGRRKLAPNTSPKKTIAGSVGAVVLTTGLVMLLGRYVFEGTVLESPIHLLALGMIVSVTGQFGDLMLSSIKRDIGIKDMAATIPGHGGLLDRFDSVILAAPATFHYIGYFVGIGYEQGANVFTGTR